MKILAIPLSVVIGIASAVALAQGTSDPTAPPRPAPTAGSWIISETTSPVDYTPMVLATTYSRGGPDSASMQLSIHCRGGRTELMVAGPAITLAGQEYTISYRVDGGPPVQLAGGPSSSGAGAAFRGDVVRLLASLPEEGDLAVRLSTRQGAAHDGTFSLSGLKVVRGKVAAACKWPPDVAPRN